MPRLPSRLRTLVFSPEAGLVVACSLILFCCVLPGTGVFERAARPPKNFLYSVCIAEDPEKISVLAEVDVLIDRPGAEPPTAHHATAIYQFVIMWDGTISTTQLPLVDGLSPGWPDIIFADKSNWYVFQEASKFGKGRKRTLYRVAPDGFRLLADPERDQMFAALQLNDATPADAHTILERHTKASGCKMTYERWGGLEDLDYESNGFLVRITTEVNGDQKSLVVMDLRTNEVTKRLLSVVKNDVHVEIDGPEKGSTAR